jgi:serine/threonine protein kinase
MYAQSSFEEVASSLDALYTAHSPLPTLGSMLDELNRMQELHTSKKKKKIVAPRIHYNASDLFGNWYCANCAYNEDRSAYVHFIGFPVDCDVLIPADEVQVRIRNHIEGTPRGPGLEDSAVWNPNFKLYGARPSILLAVNHLQHEDDLLMDTAARDVAALQKRFAEYTIDLDEFDYVDSQLKRLSNDLELFEQRTLASMFEGAAKNKGEALQKMRQILDDRQVFVEALAKHVPPTKILMQSQLATCLQTTADATLRVSELKFQLQQAEVALQSALDSEKHCKTQSETLNEISSLFSERVLGEEAANEVQAAQMIGERYIGMVNHIKCEEFSCHALKSDISNAQHTVQTRRESWQRTVCTKNVSDISSRDIQLLFRHLQIVVSPEVVISNQVDGQVISDLSVTTLCQRLLVGSLKEQLLLQHLQFCIKNKAVGSFIFNLSPESPLLWDTREVESWLHEQSLSFIAEAFKAENLNGMALLQLDDLTLDRFDVCASSLKRSQEICSKIRRLRATSMRPKSAAMGGMGAIFQILPSEISEIPHALVMKGSCGHVTQVKYQGIDAAKKQPLMNLARTLNDRDRSKFLKELEIAHQARHRSVVSMLGAYFDDDGMFLLMEWMDGGSLYDALGNQRKKTLLARQRISIAREIADGLVYLHKCGIIHRDIKSLNVLLTADGHAKLCDFGLATLQTLTTTATASQEGRQVGTLPWMAPELVLSGSKCNESTDIYSFGIIMHELMTCEVPFEGLNQHQIQAQLRNGLRPQLPDVIPSGFSSEYVALMHRCWHQDPLQRPSSQQLHVALLSLDVTAQVNAPIELYPQDYVPSSSATLKSILLTAMPEPLFQPLITRLVTAVEDVFSRAPDFIQHSHLHGLSVLEAHCLCAYTLDARELQGTKESSPFFLFNAALRSRDRDLVDRWRDFSFVFESALKKLPCEVCTVYRGLDCPLTEVSNLYEKSKRVWFNSVTSCTADKQKTLVTKHSSSLLLLFR